MYHTNVYVLGQCVMSLQYKPNVDDLIKDDDTGNWYRIKDVRKHVASARRVLIEE